MCLLNGRYIFNLLMHSYAHTHTALVMDETWLNMIMILNFRKCSVVCQWMMLIVLLNKFAHPINQVLFFSSQRAYVLFDYLLWTSTFRLIHNGILFR